MHTWENYVPPSSVPFRAFPPLGSEKKNKKDSSGWVVPPLQCALACAGGGGTGIVRRPVQTQRRVHRKDMAAATLRHMSWHGHAGWLAL